MASAEFEEKSFEGPLNSQLLDGSPYLYAPGQVLESVIGFDAAMMTQNLFFWQLWGRPSPSGIAPSAQWWPKAVPQKSLPTFHLNLFLQYKRPERLSRSYSSEWSSWNHAYFRYWVTPHQQQALESCAASLGSNGLVVYASPAFSTFSELPTHTANRTLVKATNFVEAARLKSHSRYTYIDAGKDGLAFSEPTRIPPVSMFDDLPKLIRIASDQPGGRRCVGIRRCRRNGCS
jgi:hypothetical protein